MQTIGSYEAKTHLSSILDKVDRGESFTITKHGRPVAILRPANPTRKSSKSEAIDHLKEIRKGLSLGGITIRELIDEGRK